jgi:hypothetical protein
MSRIFSIAFLAAAFLAAPSAFGPTARPDLSGSAKAATVIRRTVDSTSPMTTAKPDNVKGQSAKGSSSTTTFDDVHGAGTGRRQH